MRGLYKKPRLLIGTSSGYAQLQIGTRYEPYGQDMNIQQGSYTGKTPESYKKPPASLNKILRIRTTPKGDTM